MNNFELDLLYESGREIPHEHLSSPSRELIAEANSALGSLCDSIAKRFCRYREILPADRFFKPNLRAISGLRFLNIRQEGIERILNNAGRFLNEMQKCKPEAPCRVIGCPFCSVELKSAAVQQAIKFIAASVSYNHKRGYPTDILTVTVAKRPAWCSPLRSAHELLKGRRNELRLIVDGLFAGSSLPGYRGQITDSLAAIDVSYDSQPHSAMSNSASSVQQRLEATCDIHIHAHICARPFYYDAEQPVQERVDSVRRGIKDLLQGSYDVRVGTLDHSLTEENLLEANIAAPMLTRLCKSLAYSLSYYSKTQTLDQVSSNERPLIQAAIGKELRNRSGITGGQPIVMRCTRFENTVGAVYRWEKDVSDQIAEQEDQNDRD